MDKRKIIGFSGFMGSGKDTAALITVHAYPNLKFRQVSFADALKQAYSVMTGIPWHNTKEFKENICPVFKIARREVLQRMGTNALRNNFDKDIWINIVKHRYPEGNLVISDVRFDNEAKWIRDNGGTVIQIQRTDNMAKSIWAYHESENGVKGDFVVKNDFGANGYETFKNEIEGILETVLGKKVVEEVIPMNFANHIEAVDYWMKEFNVFKDGPVEAFNLYLKLLKEEIAEVEQTIVGSKRQLEELCDVLWVATALVLTMAKVNEIRPFMMELYKANMSKATFDKDVLKAYCEQNGMDMGYTYSHRMYAINPVTNKIAKGPVYKKFDLSELIYK
jgi:hypothetical protein